MCRLRGDVTECICALCYCTLYVTLSVSVTSFFFCWVWGRTIAIKLFICNNFFTYLLRAIYFDVTERRDESGRERKGRKKKEKKKRKKKKRRKRKKKKEREKKKKIKNKKLEEKKIKNKNKKNEEKKKRKEK